MRSLFWVLGVAIAAVLAAAMLGDNRNVVTLFWSPWRVDLSFNLFLVILLAAGLLGYALLNALGSLVGLPDRARAWRLARRDRSAQAALREALGQIFSGRYSRAHRAAQKAVKLQAGGADLEQDPEFVALGELLSAWSLHRLQDHERRDEALARARAEVAGRPAARPLDEGAVLLAAEWALDERQPERALGLLDELPPGVARRTQALRLRLQASRWSRQPLEALRTARLLAKHQGFPAEAAQGLLRSLAAEVLHEARDLEQLQRAWRELDQADRRDPMVAAHATRCLGALGHPEEGRAWLRPFWERLDELQPEEREALALALAEVVDGIGPEWLTQLESAPHAHPREPALAYVAGRALADRQLWGKARQWLESVADDPSLPPLARREAWLVLATLAEHDRDDKRAVAALRRAAHVPLANSTANRAIVAGSTRL